MEVKEPLMKKSEKAIVIDINGKKALIENLKEDKKKVHKIDPNKTIYEMMRQKINKLLDDYIDYYYPKGGRGIKVTIEVEKESGTDWHEEEFEYSDTMKVNHKVRIKS
jgi:hypothetical protein